MSFGVGEEGREWVAWRNLARKWASQLWVGDYFVGVVVGEVVVELKLEADLEGEGVEAFDSVRAVASEDGAELDREVEGVDAGEEDISKSPSSEKVA